MNDMAKLFWTGRSQAVRLPKEFRFEGGQVHIRRDKEGNVVLSAVESDDLAWAERMAGLFDEDFAKAVLDGRPGPEDMPDGLVLD